MPAGTFSSLWTPMRATQWRQKSWQKAQGYNVTNIHPGQLIRHTYSHVHDRRLTVAVHFCRDLFKSLDTDESNTVEAKELADGLKAQGYNISEQELMQLMGRVDFDRNGTLDLEEFISGLIDWNEVSFLLSHQSHHRKMKSPQETCYHTREQCISRLDLKEFVQALPKAVLLCSHQSCQGIFP